MWMWMWIWNVSEENGLSCVSFCQGSLLMIFDSIYFNCSYARTLIIYELNDIISLHAFFFLCIYISNSHSHSHFYIRGHLLLLLLLISPYNLFTFLPFYFFTFKRPFTFKLRPDAAVATSRRNLSYVPT